MNCSSPVRIQNKYNGQWLYVKCNHCDNCMIEKSNYMTIALSNYFDRFKYAYFVTLTYDNLHLPFIVEGQSNLFRLVDGQGVFSGFPYTIAESNYVFEGHENKYIPTNFPLKSGVMGVLNYRDVQLFLKRFRINYERKYKSKCDIKFYCCGEYGSNPKKSHRPHYHLIIFSNTIRFETVRDLVVSNWLLCDWDKCDIDEAIKTCYRGSIADYVSSYVNCCAYCDGLFKQKLIKPFARRSKDLNFGSDGQMEKMLFEFVHRADNTGLSSEGIRYFQRYDTKQISIPVITLSPKFLYSYFSKPRGYSNLSSDLQRRRVAEVLRTYITNKKIGRLTGFVLDNSMDYRTFLSYRRFCSLFHLNPYAYGTINYYADVFQDIHAYYASLRMREYMKTFESHGRTSYILDAYQSDVDDLDRREMRMRSRIPGYLNLDIYGYRPSSHRLSAAKQYRQKYFKKLLPKHFSLLDYEGY